MLTLGVDPGLANLGFGIVAGETDPVLVEYGCLVTNARGGTPKRLLELHEGIERVLDSHPVTDVAIEQTVFGRNTSTATSVAQAGGVVMLCAARRGIPVAEYSPPQIKNAVTGTGNADKLRVQEMVRIILNLQNAPEPHHAADALAAAICHVQNHRLALKVAASRG